MAGLGSKHPRLWEIALQRCGQHGVSKPDRYYRYPKHACDLDGSARTSSRRHGSMEENANGEFSQSRRNDCKQLRSIPELSDVSYTAALCKEI